MPVERIAGAVEGDVLRQRDRQVGFRYRHHAARLAMDDRDRAAPIALPRNAPVAQAEIDLPLRYRAIARTFLFQPPRHFLLRLGDGHAVEEARVDHAAVAVIGDVGDDERLRILIGRTHHWGYAEPVFVDEVEVALIVPRAAEDGAGTIIHQNEIRDVNRQGPSRIERMHRLHAGIEAHLLGGIDLGLRGTAMPALLDEFGERRIFLRGRGGERMIRRKRHEFRAEQCVRPRGEDLQLAFAVRRRRRIEREADQQSFGAADPIALHQPHFLRPAIERVERVEERLRILGDLEEPLRQLALLDERAGTPAEAVNHLLVREHGLVDRVPVHLRLAPLDETGAEEIEEHRLLMLVIGRVASRDLAAPVEREPHRLELRLHRRDVLVGPRLGVDLALHRGVLGRHAEGVPAHRMQHREALGALDPRHHVAHGVVAHVPHMDAPRRIGEHLQHVVFRPPAFALRLVRRGEDAALVPHFLPAGLRLGGVIALDCHWIRSRFRPDLGPGDVTRKRGAGQRRAFSYRVRSLYLAPQRSQSGSGVQPRKPAIVQSSADSRRAAVRNDFHLDPER